MLLLKTKIRYKICKEIKYYDRRMVLRKVRNEEEEIPKSVLKMKQDKERREAAKRNNAQYNKINKSEPSRNARETRNSKAAKKRKKALKA